MSQDTPHNPSEIESLNDLLTEQLLGKDGWAHLKAAMNREIAESGPDKDDFLAQQATGALFHSFRNALKAKVFTGPQLHAIQNALEDESGEGIKKFVDDECLALWEHSVPKGLSFAKNIADIAQCFVIEHANWPKVVRQWRKDLPSASN